MSLIPVASLRAPRFETCSGWKTPAKHSSVSSPAPNKTSIASGARPTCAPPLRCAGLLGCHGHPPLTCRWAPRVRCGGGEGRRLSPRPLRRSSWPLTGSRSQRAPSPTLRDGGGQVRGHAERVGAESRQTHMVPQAQESASLNETLSAEQAPARSCSYWTPSTSHSSHPPPAKPHLGIVFQ